jgi:hypothetical protein
MRISTVGTVQGIRRMLMDKWGLLKAFINGALNMSIKQGKQDYIRLYGDIKRYMDELDKKESEDC